MSRQMQYKQHPIAAVFPPLSPQAYAELKEGIRLHGQLTPVTLFEEQILDGWNRTLIADELGIALKISTPEIKDPYAYAWQLNAARRQMDSTDRAIAAEKLANLMHGSNQYKKVETSAEVSTNRTPIQRACEITGTSHASLSRYRQIKKNATPEVLAAAEKKSIGLDTGRQLSNLPKDKQNEALNGAIAKAEKNRRARKFVAKKITQEPTKEEIVPASDLQVQKWLERINRPSLYPTDLPLPTVSADIDQADHKTDHIREAIEELRPLEALIATMSWRQLYNEVQLCVQRIQSYGDKFTRVGVGKWRIDRRWQLWAEDVGQKVQTRVSMLMAQKPSNKPSGQPRRPSRSGAAQRLYDYRKELKRLLHKIDFLSQEAQEVCAETILVVANYFEERAALYNSRSPQHQNGAVPIG